MADRVETDLIVVDEKYGNLYSAVFSKGSEMFCAMCGDEVIGSEANAFFTKIVPEMRLKVSEYEDATIAHLVMPHITDERPKAAVISYAQGNRWGRTPTGKEGVLFNDGSPSYVRGTDLAMELKREMPDIYIHLVSDLLINPRVPIPAPNWEALVRQGIIDSYSSRTLLEGCGEFSLKMMSRHGSSANFNLEPFMLIIEHLLAKKE